MLKLGISVRVVGALASLAIRLKAEARRFQQMSHLRATTVKSPAFSTRAKARVLLQVHRKRDLASHPGIRFHQIFEGRH